MRPPASVSRDGEGDGIVLNASLETGSKGMGSGLKFIRHLVKNLGNATLVSTITVQVYSGLQSHSLQEAEAKTDEDRKDSL
jgi:hypothetical protein